MEDNKLKKLRGGYYTPKPISDFISKWAICSQNDLILEPSCGDGEFIDSLIEVYLQLGSNKTKIRNSIHAVEYNSIEALKAKDRFENKGIEINDLNIHIGDFFKYCKDHLSDKIFFDSIVGNPPFIRYQDFPEEQRIPAFGLMKRAGLTPNRLTNTWIPFLIASALLLKSKGRLGMVLPAELFQVNYAAQTRLFLSEYFSKINIITFKKLVFDGIQQEIILLLAEKDNIDKKGITVIELNDINDLNTFDLKNRKSDIKFLDHSSEKWTQYFLNNKEIKLLRRIKEDPSIPLSGEHIDVDVGIVTGENKFFVVPKSEVEKFKLDDYTLKIVGRSNHLKGIILTDNDFDNLSELGYPIFLFNPPNIDFDKLPSNLKAYIKFGEINEYNSGYKCRIRKNWWIVPSQWCPDAFMLRQVHEFPKIVLNRCNATSTDTLHRVKLINGIKGEVIASAFLNSLTFAFSEVTGRGYGGGVLTFEPSEAERLPLPLNCANELDINLIDKLIRDKKIEDVLDITDSVLLKKGLNFTQSDIRILRNIWNKLRDRRINRRK